MLNPFTREMFDRIDTAALELHEALDRGVVLGRHDVEEIETALMRLHDAFNRLAATVRGASPR
jgi:hypothetical protein